MVTKHINKPKFYGELDKRCRKAELDRITGIKEDEMDKKPMPSGGMSEMSEGQGPSGPPRGDKEQVKKMINWTFQKIEEAEMMDFNICELKEIVAMILGLIRR